jgi:hypothetical protein
MHLISTIAFYLYFFYHYFVLDFVCFISIFEDVEIIINRLLGVDKVCIHTYKLNNLAMKVLEYYESIGIAMVFKGYSEPNYMCNQCLSPQM